MQEGIGSKMRDWIESFWRIEFSGNVPRDLETLLDESLRAGGADRGFVLLLKRNTVLSEVGRTSSGDRWLPDDNLRKAAARLAIHSQDGRRPDVLVWDRGVVVPIPIDEKLGAAIALSSAEPKLVDPTVLFAVAAARILAEAYEARRAREIAEHAEEALHHGGVGAVAYLKTISQLERDAIELALRTCGWNKEEAARRLGISRASIYMKVKRYGLARPPREQEGEGG